MAQKFADRLNALLDKQGKNLTELAEFMNITPQATQQWSKGVTEPRGKKLERIAEFFNVPLVDLIFGGSSKMTVDNHEENTESLAQAEAVPLISFVQAGHWNEATDPYNVGDAEEWIACPVKHSPRTYALKIRGESMYNPVGRPSFEEGDIIFCDPAVEARNRSLVIVRLDGSKDATFKRLLIDGDRKYLEALNPDWPNRIFEVTEEATICGVVIARLETLI